MLLVKKIIIVIFPWNEVDRVADHVNDAKLNMGFGECGRYSKSFSVGVLLLVKDLSCLYRQLLILLPTSRQSG